MAFNVIYYLFRLLVLAFVPRFPSILLSYYFAVHSLFRSRWNFIFQIFWFCIQNSVCCDNNVLVFRHIKRGYVRSLLRNQKTTTWNCCYHFGFWTKCFLALRYDIFLSDIPISHFVGIFTSYSSIYLHLSLFVTGFLVRYEYLYNLYVLKVTVQGQSHTSITKIRTVIRLYSFILGYIYNAF